MRGKSINIFIPDSNPRGIKICDIKNSIVKAIYFPRQQIDDVLKRDELTNQGIYFLFGDKDEVGKPLVYIGETEKLSDRLKQHNKNKEFWNFAICFISEKNNINKAHIKYLENFCCTKAKEINKCVLDNTTNPTPSRLTEQDEDFILSFYDDLKIIIATLGYPIFEETKKDKSKILICKGKDAYAEGEYTEEGLLVFKGSKANLVESDSAGSWVVNMRNNLEEKGIIRKEGNVYIFSQDHLFNSPSAAAVVILARQANGWTQWKAKNGKTMDEIYRQ